MAKNDEDSTTAKAAKDAGKLAARIHDEINLGNVSFEIL
jgi:hypothetical protein